jgi:biopolymer transport protein TolR
MSFSIQSRSRRYSRRRAEPMAEINVTPFVDVMLVLLVIFMVTAPLLTVGVKVDLPETKAGAVSGQDEPLAISVDKEGRVFVQDSETDLDGLVPKLIAISGNNPDIRIFVRGDASVNYGRVMQVMGLINNAGFRKVALIARQPREAKPATQDKKRKQ